MNDFIISLSDRGQVTIPQQLREQVGVKHFVCTVSDGSILLQPLQTREEFLKELENSEKDWKKHGGLTLQQMKKQYL